MRKLEREEVRAAEALAGGWDLQRTPLQAGLGGSPWRVAVASALLCRTRRAQAEPTLRDLLGLWPDAPSLARADADELHAVVKRCGFGRQRARQLQRMSLEYIGCSWDDMRELTGVGKYVADAVGLFCFGCTELESSDAVLAKHAASLQLAVRS